MQGAPQLVATDHRGLSAGAREVLVDLLAQALDLRPPLLQIGRQLRHLRVDLADRARRVGEVGDEPAEVARLTAGDLADGDVDVERRLLHADQVMAAHPRDRHEDAEDEQHFARREVGAERHDARMYVRTHQRDDGQVQVRADPRHRPAGELRLHPRVALAQDVDNAGAGEAAERDDAEEDDEEQRRIPRAVDRLQREEATEADQKQGERPDEDADVPLLGPDLEGAACHCGDLLPRATTLRVLLWRAGDGRSVRSGHHVTLRSTSRYGSLS